MKIKTCNLQLVTWILLLAFFLRVNGLDFGLPYVFHDDEHQYVEAGLAFLNSPQAAFEALAKLNNPPLFKVTLGSLYFLYTYLLLPDPADQQAALGAELWLTFFQYTGRLASAALGWLTVALLFALGKRLYNPTAGLLAAFLLAVAFLPVREAHFAVNDTPLTFLVTLTLYLAAGILRRGRWLDYLAAGFAIGLASATKYTGVYLLAALLVAHLLGDHGRRLRQAKRNWPGLFFSPRLWAGLALAAVGFVAAAPVVLTAWPELIRHLGKLSEYGQSGYHDLLLAPPLGGGWLFYLTSLGWGVGWPMFTALLAAVVAAIIFHYREDLLLAIFALALFIGMGAQQMVFVRFILPVVPPLILLLAAWLVRLRQLNWLRNHRPLWALLLIFLVAPPLATSFWFGVLLSRPDTRELAADWLQANLPDGAVIYPEIHAVPRYDVMGRVSLPYVQLDELAFNQPDPLAFYQAQGLQYIIASDFHHDRQFSDPAKEAGRQQWLDTLRQQQLIQEFQPYWRPSDWFTFDLRYGPWHDTLLRRLPGPVIRVYAVEPAPARQQLNPFVEANQLLDKAALYGYELEPTLATPAGEVKVAIYWLKRNWQETDGWFVALADEQGFELTRAPAELAPEFEPEFQRDGRTLKSEAKLALPAGTPPGAYQLRLGLSDRAQANELASLTIPSAQVTVTEPESPAESTNLTGSLEVRLAPGLALVSAELQPDSLVIGEDNWLVLLWAATAQIEQDYSLELTLLDSQEHSLASWSGQPVYGRHPTSTWPAGRLVRDPWNLTLPETETGLVAEATYQLRLAVLDEAGNVAGSAPLGPVQVSSRRRSATIPVMQQTVAATWGEAIKLLGFNIRAIPDTANSGWLELDLFWQSLAATGTDYWVGLKLVDGHGQVILIQDAPPKGGDAPTSSWQPGEVVHDFRSLRYDNLAMDRTYQLTISLINPQTGQAVPAKKDGQSADTLLLTSWP